MTGRQIKPGDVLRISNITRVTDIYRGRLVFATSRSFRNRIHVELVKPELYPGLLKNFDIEQELLDLVCPKRKN